MIPYLRGLLLALSETGRHAFSKRLVQSVRTYEQRAPRFRASFALVDNEHGEPACIACMQCAKVCPSGVISVSKGKPRVSEVTGKKRGYATDYTLNLQACIFCELCIQVCPSDAIVGVRVQEQPAFAREDLVLTMDKLIANADKPRAWAKGSVLREAQDPKRGPRTPQGGDE